MPTSSKEIEAFLNQFKKTWQPYCTVAPREKNEDALIILGITAKHRQSEILSLKKVNYHKGPEADENGSPGEIWKFRKTIKKHEVYIKLKIRKIDGKDYAKCISFHPSEYWGGYNV